MEPAAKWKESIILELKSKKHIAKLTNSLFLRIVAAPTQQKSKQILQQGNDEKMTNYRMHSIQNEYRHKAEFTRDTKESAVTSGAPNYGLEFQEL